jgi:C-type mannose receptor
MTLLLASACTVRNPAYQPEDAVKDTAAPPSTDLRAPARTDLPGTTVPELDAGPALDVAAAPDGSPDAPPDLPPGDLGGSEPGTCLPDEHLRGNRCYAMLSPFVPVGQQLAAQLCADRGATLVSIGTLAENAFLYGLLPSTAQAAWIGLVRTGPGKKDFVWASGEPFAFASWAPGEPNNTGGLEDCVVLWGPALADPKLRGHWNDAPCAFPRDLVLCERVLAP